ncbi:GNAT family N-acetyltransferase [Streptomyces sp. NPDC051940]|uniref:GNAT family N-acetyltransferase n=1 Tax=Streptomyces sp. NPDC051940 TaxID=3155675 RepID=UPI003419931A
MPIRTAEVPVADIIPLRWAVLRPGMPRESALFAEDDAPGAFHMAAYTDDGEVGAVVSFCPEQLPGEDAKAYRFRGMASEPALRGQGYGEAVLRAGLKAAADRGAEVVWCNARSVARGFYEKYGFEVRGEEFEIPTVGLHWVMAIAVGSVPARP